MKIFKTILTVLPLILFIFVLCGCDEEIIPVGGEKEKYEVKFIVDGVIFETQIGDSVHTESSRCVLAFRQVK